MQLSLVIEEVLGILDKVPATMEKVLGDLVKFQLVLESL